jgi:putative protein-disulfide isomerase
MCSWCWGFTPVFDAIKSHYADRLTVALVLGGLRPGTRDPVTDSFRDEILHHWQQVKNLTGQSFTFDGAMPEGFVYDTEKPSRGVVAVGELNPDRVMPYFKEVQAAFYVDQKDVTQQEVLAELAASFDIDTQQFKTAFESASVKDKTLAHFARARHLGVRGFPTLIMQTTEGYALLTHGYRPFDQLQPDIDRALA